MMIRAVKLIAVAVLCFYVFETGSRLRPARMTCERASFIVANAFQKLAEVKEIDVSSEAFKQSFLKNLFSELDPFRLFFLKNEVLKTAIEISNNKFNFTPDICEGLVRFTDQQRAFLYERVNRAIEQVKTSSKPPVMQSFSQVSVELERAEFEQSSARLRERQHDFFSVALKEHADALLWFDTKKDFLASLAHELFVIDRPSQEIVMQAYLRTLDRFTRFFEAAEYEDFKTGLEGSFLGIGVSFKKLPFGWMVEAMDEGAPLGRTGKVQIGDVVTHLNGADVRYLNSRQFSEQWKNFKSVLLTFSRGGKQSYQVEVFKEVFYPKENQVTFSDFRDSSGNEVVWIKIPSFFSSSEDRQTESVSEWVERGLTERLQGQEKSLKIVLDLRNNPGGYIEEALKLAGLFIGKKNIVEVRNEMQDYFLLGQSDKKFDAPLTLIMNENSASASEILAASLKDYQRATLVGKKSFGKGSVQKLFPLNYPLLSGFITLRSNDFLKVTTHYYYSPKQICPDLVGIRPDVDIELPIDKPEKVLWARITSKTTNKSRSSPLKIPKLAKVESVERSL